MISGAIVLAGVAGFLLGSIPFSWILARLLGGLDIRSIGSGNVGATNVARSLGFRVGAAALLLDAAKGSAAALLGQAIDPAGAGGAGALLGGGLAVLGHNFTPFLGFRGGKGVATATGVLLALDWRTAAAAIAVFFVVRLATGKVFFGSIALGLTLAAAAILLHRDDAFAARLPVTLLCCALAGFLVWTHRNNLHRHFAAAKGGTP
jgi:glycerol-3-phosphate acyltransferase PlsY